MYLYKVTATKEDATMCVCVYIYTHTRLRLPKEDAISETQT